MAPKRHATPPSKPGPLFEKGKSGNPGGLTKSMREARELAKGNLIAHVPAALKVIVDVMNDKTAKDRDRLVAAQYIFDQACGKPVQAITGDPDNPVSLTGLTVTFVKPEPDSPISIEA